MRISRCALRIHRQGRRAHVPRGQQLRRRRRADRARAARGEARQARQRPHRWSRQTEKPRSAIAAEAGAEPKRSEPAKADKRHVSRNLPRQPQARPRLQRARRACRFPNPSEPPATIPAREMQQTKPALPADPAAPVVVEVRRQGEAVRLTFPFAVPTPAAVFRRADTIWLVFDSQAPIDINKIAAQSGQTHPQRRGHALAAGPGGPAQARQAEAHQHRRRRTRLDRRRRRHDARADAAAQRACASCSRAGAPASPFRSISRAQLHRLADEEVGDTLLVVTALGPARGFLKPQEFVEFNALVSTHGVVIQPRADDVTAEVSTTRSSSRVRAAWCSRARPRLDDGAGARPGMTAVLRYRICLRSIRRPGASTARADFRDRQTQLIAEAAAAEGARRAPAQLELARFYLARDLIAEAKGVLDVAASDEQAAADGTAAAAARGRQRHAGARRRRHEGPVAGLRSPAAPTSRCGARSRWRSRANGSRRAKASARSKPRPRRCRSSCSASPSTKRCAPRSKCATSARRKPAQRIRHARAGARSATPSSPC